VLLANYLRPLPSGNRGCGVSGSIIYNNYLMRFAKRFRRIANGGNTSASPSFLVVRWNDERNHLFSVWCGLTVMLWRSEPLVRDQQTGLGSSHGFGNLALVIVPCINPHWLGFACPLKPTLLVEIQGPSVRNKHMLVKSVVPCHETAHQLCTNAASLILW